MAPSTCISELCALVQQLCGSVADGATREAGWLAVGVVVGLVIFYVVIDYMRAVSVPTLNIELTEAETCNQIAGDKYAPAKTLPKDRIPCYDPGNMQYLGDMPAMAPEEVRQRITRAKQASKVWRHSSFKQRKQLLRILQKYIISHQEEICRVSARDSGKVLLDAVLGEVIVTCEKLHWLIHEGEQHLRPERRSAGVLSFYKKARVEYHPLGVIGAIVPWNYPFHNVLNPLSAAVFTGNAIIIKVSEYASYSVRYYQRIIDAALAAAGAPADLVQIVTGYGDAGSALVTGGVDKVIFVGSTQVGKKVMAAAAETLTPVTLELGGKDPLIICEDADLDRVVPICIKAAFLSCGQNCAGGERFLVHTSVLNKFVERVVPLAKGMRQGAALCGETLDAGAMCMPGLAEKVQGLVDDAVSKGAQVLAGGKAVVGSGQFFQPTVLTGVNKSMQIWTEEVFGPVMTIIPFSTDDEAVRIANDCPFGLGSNVFCRSPARARRIASQLEAGMSALNDFASTYTCQSLPFGGVKHSGFGRFAGIEGLRALCVPKSVCEDRLPWLMNTSIPKPWQVPVQDTAFPFATSMVAMFYGLSLLDKLAAVMRLAGIFLLPAPAKKAKSS